MEKLFLKNSKGFTLIEILVVIAIFTGLLFLTFYFFGPLNKKEVLEKDVASLTALLRNARLLSVASKNAQPYGIHLESDRAVLFEGSTYVPGGANENTLLFSREVYLSAHALGGSGQDILFSRLTGNTANYGSVTLSLKDDSASTTVNILQTGIIQ